MEKLVAAINGQMLIYAAISPNIITAPYVHMRRIACDAYSNIGETGYTLNSTTYGWWLGKLYEYMDADHVVFKAEPAGMNRARLTSALVTGTLITGDDHSAPGVWHATAQTLLQDQGLLDIARTGRPFRPIEGNTGDQPGNFFVRKEGRRTWLAMVNYGDKAMEYTIRADRWGIRHHGELKELFSGNVIKFPGVLTVVIPPADAMIYRMD
jgi:alpha-galactosidase